MICLIKLTVQKELTQSDIAHHPSTSQPENNKQNIEEPVNQQSVKGDNKSKKYFYQFQNNILLYCQSRRASVIPTLKLGTRQKRA